MHGQQNIKKKLQDYVLNYHPNYKLFMNLICKILSLLNMSAQYTRQYKIQVSHVGTARDSRLLGCYAACLGT